MAATTAADWVAETRRHLLQTTREELNRLNGAYTAAQTTLTLEFDLGMIKAGARLSIDLERFHVWSVNGQVATVQFAQDGTTNANHADDSIVRVNSRFDDFAIFEALNAELLDLSSPANGLYKIVTVDVTETGIRDTYDITGATNVIDIYDAYWNDYGGTYTRIPVNRWKLDRDAPTSDFPSGFALWLPDVPAGRTTRVSYKSGFTALTNLATTLSTVGLPAAAYDIPPLGAALRLMSVREIPRNFIESQSTSRRAEEVPAGAIQNSWRGLAALHQRRVAAEALRLQTQYPTRLVS